MQTRWICGGCDREWLFARSINYTTTDLNGHLRPEGAAWEPSQGCPLCGHQGIRQETYQPAFPGADIPRNMAGLMDAYQQLTPPAPITVPERRNTTLLDAPRRPKRKRKQR